MQIKNVLNFFGLWSYPLGITISGMIDYFYHSISMQALTFNAKSISEILIGGLAVPAVVAISNVYDYLIKGKTNFTPALSGKKDVTSISESKKKAMYPSIPSDLLSSKPEGFIVGRQGKSYVRIPIERANIMNSVIIGSPGSGKTSGPFLTTLIPNFMHDNPPITAFVLDIKPEIYKKCVGKNRCKNVKVVDFTDRSSYGWDVYHSLSKSSNMNEIIRVFDGIVRSLIVSSNPKDSFFVNNARNIAKGLLLYHYAKGEGFIDSIKAIASEDIMTHISNALQDKEYCPEDGMVYALLKKYSDKQSDAFQDIELTLAEHLNVFLNSDVQYHLRDNPLKASPQDLNDCISVFVCIPLPLLDEFGDLLRLITYQVCSAMEARGEDWKSPVLMILDELGRLGKIENLKNLLSLGRSSGISVNMAFQDMSQLEATYSKEGARTIINLSEVTCIFSCRDIETTKTLSYWGGEYREEKISHNRSALLHQGDGKQHISEEYRKILDISDIQSLRKSGEVILFVEGKYYRTKQLRYYQDKLINARYQQIMKEQKIRNKE
ncbi:MAG: type IV secretory system conjugative DNA transfer family protein [Lachnospiraceae bacterium]|nr:type IV secretory system conjugative DNA transfer family protein [Lachnospiraceae bacterium]